MSASVGRGWGRGGIASDCSGGVGSGGREIDANVAVLELDLDKGRDGERGERGVEVGNEENIGNLLGELAVAGVGPDEGGKRGRRDLGGKERGKEEGCGGGSEATEHQRRQVEKLCGVASQQGVRCLGGRKLGLEVFTVPPEPFDEELLKESGQ
jgi:hypothetical protein